MSRRLATIGLICAALCLACVIGYRLLDTPFWNVNGSRLMPSFELSRGVNYYVLLPPGGPLYSTLYGPLVALVYLPATWFSTPNSAVLAGAMITVLLCFSAAAYLHFAKSGCGAGDIAAFLAAGFLMCYLEPLKYSCFNIHADGPGLAFSSAACGSLYGAPYGRLSGARLLISATCAVLALLCKQMFLPVPFVLLAWLAVVAGRGIAVRYLAWLVAAGAVLGGIALWTSGPERLYHCLIWLPAHHPWGASALVSAIQAMRSFVRVSLPVLILLLAYAIYLAAGGVRGTSLRYLAAHRCVPLLAVGVALAPFSIAGRAKIGGDVNSLSFATFFLVCGLTVMLADLAQPLAQSVLIAIIVLLAVSEAPLALDIRSKVRQLPQASQEVAFEYLRRHPGEAYFPWFPLAHFCAEHKFRHYGFGIGDRLLAGESVSMAEFRAYVPANPRIIAFSSDGRPDAFGFDLMKYLPAFRDQVTDPELPGWLLYAKAPPVQSLREPRSQSN